MKRKGWPLKSQRSFQLSLHALDMELTGKQSGHCPLLALVLGAGKPEMCLQLVVSRCGMKKRVLPSVSVSLLFPLSLTAPSES